MSLCGWSLTLCSQGLFRSLSFRSSLNFVARAYKEWMNEERCNQLSNNSQSAAKNSIWPLTFTPERELLLTQNSEAKELLSRNRVSHVKNGRFSSILSNNAIRIMLMFIFNIGSLIIFSFITSSIYLHSTESKVFFRRRRRWCCCWCWRRRRRNSPLFDQASIWRCLPSSLQQFP